MDYRLIIMWINHWTIGLSDDKSCELDWLKKFPRLTPKLAVLHTRYTTLELNKVGRGKIALLSNELQSN